MDQLGRERRIEFFAKHIDVNVDHVAVVVEMNVPDILEDLSSGHDPVGIAHEILEKRELLRRQGDLLRTSPRDPRQEIQLEIRETQDAGLGRSHRLAPEQCTNPRQQLFKFEWFGQVVIGAGIQARHFRTGAAQGRKHQNRALESVPPQVTSGIKAVLIGQHDIENNQRIIDFGDKGLGRLPAIRHINRVTGLGQTFFEKARHLLLVFNHENAHVSLHTTFHWVFRDHAWTYRFDLCRSLQIYGRVCVLRIDREISSHMDGTIRRLPLKASFITPLAACITLTSQVCLASTPRDVPVAHRVLNQLNVVSARLKRISAPPISDVGSNEIEYAVDVDVEFQNDCFAPRPDEIPNKLVFSEQGRSDGAVDVQLYRLPMDYECPLEDRPVRSTVSLQQFFANKDLKPRVYINGIEAR